jgi:DNA-binding transcriptional LysR family regulator
MDKLAAMRVFVRVAQLSSFTRVAEEAELSSSYVSKLVLQLEESLGTKLLQRTTRRLQLTEAGLAYLPQCRDILEQLDRADAMVAEKGDRPKGRLRINLPLSFGLIELGPVMAGFAERYPELELDLNLSDQPVDLLAGGYDCGLRLSTQIQDSSYVAVRLGRYRIMVCASPGYLVKHGKPSTPAELAAHKCFVYAYATDNNRWPLRHGDQDYVAVNGAVRVNSTPFMKSFIVRGLGIGVLPEFVARPEIEDGRLVELLKDVSRPALELFAVYPERSFVPAKVRVWIDYMKAAVAAMSEGRDGNRIMLDP